MDNNSNITPHWAGFRRQWIWVAIILFLLLLLLMFLGYGPGGENCEKQPEIVEKVVEKEKLVDNPELLTRIATLEKENAQIALLKKENSQISSLKSNIEDLTKSSSLVTGLQAKVKALESVDLNFDNPVLQKRISLLETENASISDLKKRIAELEALNAKIDDDKTAILTKRISELEKENSLIAGLKAKVTALEAVDVNFIKSKDDSALLKRITDLEKENDLIVGLKAKVSALEAVDVNFIKPKDDTALLKRIGDLEKENALIDGLKAKVSALEAVDVNFIQPKDDTALLKRIDELEKQNGLIPGLKAKVKALEDIDINFDKNDSADVSGVNNSNMALPDTAKLYFEPGRSYFPRDTNQSMADVIVHLRANPSSKVEISGFHDAVGRASWNRRLSAKRSNRVKQILVDAGISSSRINVKIPTQTLGTGSPEEARRVEVKVSN